MHVSEKEITASPLRPTLEDLRGLPKVLVITDKANVLRDEGEAYANKLRKASVPVTSVRIVHDFVMLNALSKTEAARSAIDLAVTWLKKRVLTKQQTIKKPMYHTMRNGVP